jgi:chloramphenicol-sensitive protein RarD
LVALTILGSQGQLAFGALGPHIDTLLILGGILTAVPLALFASGARQIPYSTVGLIQYVAPTLQMALGVWLYHEPMSQQRLLGFCCIWLGLVIYAADGWLAARRVGTLTSA